MDVILRRRMFRLVWLAMVVVVFLWSIISRPQIVPDGGWVAIGSDFSYWSSNHQKPSEDVATVPASDSDSKDDFANVQNGWGAKYHDSADSPPPAADAPATEVTLSILGMERPAGKAWTEEMEGMDSKAMEGMEGIELDDGSKPDSLWDSDSLLEHERWNAVFGKDDEDTYEDDDQALKKLDDLDTNDGLNLKKPTKMLDPLPIPELLAPFSKAKCAVIIDSQPSTRLPAILLHFHAMLGPTWPVFIFVTDPGSFPSTSFMTRMPDGTRYDPRDTKIIHPFNIRRLPREIKFTSHKRYSQFLVDPWLWDQLAPFEKVLLFQSDSILCANSARTVDEFLVWDFIGAPIAPFLGSGYNGGLSIRNRTLMLDIIKGSQAELRRKKPEYEDRWYYKKMLMMRDVKLPHPSLASDFAVESWYNLRPLGYHQPTVFYDEKMEEKREWCPEIDLIEGPRLSSSGKL